MRYRNNKIIGTVFVIIGIIFLLDSLDIVNLSFSFLDIGFLIRKFWPALFLILPGLALHSVFFSGKNRDAGILVPSGILITTGIVLQISMLFGMWNILLPGFIFAVAVGLFELYFFGKRDKGLLVPVAILTVTSLIFFDVFTVRKLFGISSRHIIIPLALIIFGLIIIYRNRSPYDDFK